MLGSALLLTALHLLAAAWTAAAIDEVVVHVLPHSHCDPGYKKTVESYYLTEVKHILDSVVDALQQREDRRFVWAEGVFLERWWVDQPGDEDHQRKKEAFARLVEEGRIEIVNGGFVMHDDAITLYDSQIRQTTLGHVGILGRTVPTANPRIGYQIDPFGPSAFTPTFMALTGMDALIYNRIPDAMKQQMKESRTLEFIWRGSGALADEVSEVLVHVYDDHYSAPKGFDWEDSSNPPITAENVAEQSDVFVGMMVEKRQYYRTSHVLVPFGTDFRHQNSTWQFHNMDQIVDYINRNQHYYEQEFGVRISVRYSTTSEYFSMLRDEDASFPVMSGSPFLPLVTGDALTGAWSGFYTSYPRLKQMTRGVEMLLRNTRLVMLASGLLNSKSTPAAEKEALRNKLMTAERQVALLAHHDAIPATGYNFVNYDYERRMKVAASAMQELIVRGVRELLHAQPNTCTTELTGVVGGGAGVAFNDIIAENVVLTYSMGQPPLPLVIVNSLGWEVKRVVHVPVSFGLYGDSALLQPDVMITDDAGTPVLSQATPVPHTDGIYRISFVATVPPLGAQTYFLQTCYITSFTDVDVTYSPHCARNVTSVSTQAVYDQGVAAGNVRLRFSDATGDLSSIVVQDGQDDAQELPVAHSFAEYLSDKDTVYHFKAPVGVQSEPVPNERGVIQAFEGPLYSEVLVRYDSAHMIRYRIYNVTQSIANSDDFRAGVEIEAMVGPLARFKTAVSKFSTALKTSNRFFYDQNGYQWIEATVNSSLGVGCNFHPMASRAWLLDEPQGDSAADDKLASLTLTTSDVRGVTSLRSGELEVMWHRRAAHEQLRGNDESAIRSSLWLSVGGAGDADLASTKRASKLVANDLMVVALTAGEAVKKTGGSLVHNSLPRNTHVVTLLDETSLDGLQQCLGGRACPTEKPLNDVDDRALYLQLENLDEASATTASSTATSVDLADFFRSRRVVDAESMGLSFRYTMAEVKARKHWQADGENSAPAAAGSYDRYCVLRDRSLLMMEPKQICSLRLRVKPQ